MQNDSVKFKNEFKRILYNWVLRKIEKLKIKIENDNAKFKKEFKNRLYNWVLRKIEKLKIKIENDTERKKIILHF